MQDFLDHVGQKKMQKQNSPWIQKEQRNKAWIQEGGFCNYSHPLLNSQASIFFCFPSILSGTEDVMMVKLESNIG